MDHFVSLPPVDKVARDTLIEQRRVERLSQGRNLVIRCREGKLLMGGEQVIIVKRVERVVDVPAEISLDAPGYSGDENTNITFDINRTERLDQIIAVDWAISGVSVAPLSGAVIFRPGDTVKSVTVAAQSVTSTELGPLDITNPRILSGSTTTLPIIGAVPQATITVFDVDVGPPKPGGPDHIIPLGVSTWDGIVNGVQPGHIIEIEGGVRGPLRIDEVHGLLGDRVIIRSDPTVRNIIRRTTPKGGDFVFRLRNCDHFELDGSFTAGEIYGIEVTFASGATTGNPDNPSSFLHLSGICQDYAIRNIEIDGGFSAGLSNNGVGIQHNDNNVTFQSPFVQAWRENILVELCKIREVQGEGIYLGPNWLSPLNGTPLRNIEVRFNDVQNVGRDGIQVKKTIEGVNRTHHNFVKNTGIRTADPQAGQKSGISFWEGYGDIYNNWVEDAGEHGCWWHCQNRPASEALLPVKAYNNVVIRAGFSTDPIALNGSGIIFGNKIGAAFSPLIEIYSNTVIECSNRGIFVEANQEGDVTIQNNISVGNSNDIDDDSTGSSTVNNNETGSVSAQNFTDAANDDYSLTGASPAVDGVSTGLVAPTDFDDVARPSGAEDQGAFERVQRNLLAEITFSRGTLVETPEQDADGVYREFGEFWGWVKFGTPITITNITNQNPAIATYTGPQPPSGSGYTLGVISSGMTELSERMIRPKSITSSTFECHQDGDDTGFTTPRDSTSLGATQTNATGYGSWSGTVSAQNHRRLDSSFPPEDHPYNEGADRYAGLGIVTGSFTPPTNKIGVALPISPLEGSKFLSHQINYWADHTRKEDGGITNSGFNAVRCQLFWAHNRTSVDYGETIWYGFSMALPSNFHQDTQTNNYNFSATNLFEIEDEPNIPQANMIVMGLRHKNEIGPNMHWMFNGLFGASTGSETDISLGSIINDIGLWTTFIWEILPDPTNGVMRCWSSTGPYTSGQRRKMVLRFERVGSAVGYVPSNGRFKLGWKQYKFAWHERSNTMDSFVQWLGVDSVRWGTEESHGTGFRDVHPFNETLAQALL